MKPVCLASRSPRRAALLEQIGVPVRVCAADVDERALPGEAPGALALRLAEVKARAAVCDCGVVIAADTIVALPEGPIFGKPADAEEAVAMLLGLSDRMHEVFTAVAVRAGDRLECALSRSRVWFGPVSEAEAQAYWASGEPADKAGAYAVQGLGAVFIRAIEGSFSGIMGLPLYETATLLARFGIRPGWLEGA